MSVNVNNNSSFQNYMYTNLDDRTQRTKGGGGFFISSPFKLGGEGLIETGSLL